MNTRSHTRSMSVNGNMNHSCSSTDGASGLQSATAPVVQQEHASGSSSHVDSDTNAITLQDLMAQMAIMNKTLHTLFVEHQQGRSVVSSVHGVSVSPSVKTSPDVSHIGVDVDGPRTHIGECGNTTVSQGTVSVSSNATGVRSPTLPLCNINVGNEEIYRLLTPDKALKAPKLEGSIDYPTWRTTFVNFAYGYGVHTMLIHGPQHMILPTQHTQLTAEERILAMAGYTLKAGGDESKATVEYKYLQFAYLALQHAVSGHSMAKSVVSAVPSPNATEAWRKLETALHSSTKVQCEIVQRKLQDLQQYQSEDIATYAARAGELSTKLASLGAPQSEEQVMTAFTRGMRSLAAWQRDALKQRCHSLEEMVALARSYEEEDALQKGRSRPTVPSVPSSAMFAGTSAGGQHKGNKGKMVCHYCKKAGHLKKDCRKRLSAEKQSTSSASNSGSRVPVVKSGSGNVCGWCLKGPHRLLSYNARGHAISSVDTHFAILSYIHTHTHQIASVHLYTLYPCGGTSHRRCGTVLTHTHCCIPIYAAFMWYFWRMSSCTLTPHTLLHIDAHYHTHLYIHRMYLS